MAGLCAGRGDEMGHSYTPGIRVMGQQICVLVVGLGWDTEVILPVSVSRGSMFRVLVGTVTNRQQKCVKGMMGPRSMQ